MLAISYYDRLVQFWTMDGVLTHTLQGTGYGAPGSQFSADGALFAAMLPENWQVDQVRLWNTQDWSIAGTFSVGNKDDFRIAGLSLAPDQQSMAIMVADSSHVTTRIYIQILTIPDGVLVATLEHSGLSGQPPAFSPSGEMLASYSPGRSRDYGRLQVWRTSDWQWLYNYDVMPERIERGWALSVAGSLAWSPDSTLLAVGVTDGTIQILRADTGELLATLPGHRMWAPAVAFSPDGRLLASCSLDGTIMLWGTR
jgi:WD40 repeat protein